MDSAEFGISTILNMSTPAPPVPHFFAHKRLSSRLLCLSPQPRQDPFLLQWNHAPKTTGWSSMTNTFQPFVFAHLFAERPKNKHTHSHTRKQWNMATWCTTSTVPGVGSLGKGLNYFICFILSVKGSIDPGFQMVQTFNKNMSIIKQIQMLS